MPSTEEKIHAIVRARRAASGALLNALRTFPRMHFSEADLAARWLQEIRSDSTIRDCGWYTPPPHGMSVLVGTPPDYARLRYNSLREVANWPSSSVHFSSHSLLYPYFSAVDRSTLLMGDFVGTFYAGDDESLHRWLATAYRLTMTLADFIQPGQSFSDVFCFAQQQFASLGLVNNTYSQSGGLASDIGHTIPGFIDDAPALLALGSAPTSVELATALGSARQFVSKDNINVIGNDFALTIEPQLMAEGLPMASFHIIVAAADGKKTIVTEFAELFQFFGMPPIDLHP